MSEQNLGGDDHLVALPPAKVISESHFASYNHQELFGHAFLRAIAALADCEFSVPEPDQSKRDVTIKTEFDEATGYELLDPQLSMQVKTTTGVSSETASDFSFTVDIATYNALRKTRLAFPRFLVVIRIPHHPDIPLAQDLNRTVLFHAPFFVTLKGQGALPAGQKSKTVRVPKANVLTPNSLRKLLEQAAQKQL